MTYPGNKVFIPVSSVNDYSFTGFVENGLPVTLRKDRIQAYLPSVRELFEEENDLDMQDYLTETEIVQFQGIDCYCADYHLREMLFLYAYVQYFLEEILALIEQIKRSSFDDLFLMSSDTHNFRVRGIERIEIIPFINKGKLLPRKEAMTKISQYNNDIFTISLRISQEILYYKTSKRYPNIVIQPSHGRFYLQARQDKCPEAIVDLVYRLI